MTSTKPAAAEPEVAAARAPRKDAARNHALLLEAAREVFAERGLDASLDDIARRAGLGIGTAYRHFQNKQQVAEALFTKAIAEIVADAERALTIADPWLGFVGFFTWAAERQANDRGLSQVLMGTYPIADCLPIRDQLDVPITLLFDRAIAAGVLRPDAVPTDAGVIFAMLGAVYELGSPGSPELWRRYLTVVLDGMRSSNPGPLPAAALTEQELDAAFVQRHSKLRS